MESEGSIPRLQQPATCPYPEPDQSSPRSLHSTSWRSILILSLLRLGLTNGPLLSGFPPKPCKYLLSPMCATCPAHLITRNVSQGLGNLFDSWKQRSEQQDITWRLQFNTNVKSVFATAIMRWHFVVVSEFCCIYVVRFCVCSFYCVWVTAAVEHQSRCHVV